MNNANRPENFVRTNAIYTLAEIKYRLALGDAALREARRAGLTVRYVGKRAFIIGRELIDFIDREGMPTSPTRRG